MGDKDDNKYMMRAKELCVMQARKYTVADRRQTVSKNCLSVLESRAKPDNLLYVCERPWDNSLNNIGPKKTSPPEGEEPEIITPPAWLNKVNGMAPPRQYDLGNS